jgi:peptidoglycan/xylan/chitin deacetylase (PgdA/CDA1 family)
LTRWLKRLVGRVLGVPVASLLDLGLRLTDRRAGLVLLYHRVGDPQSDPERELVPALGTRLFEAQLCYVKARYDVVPVSEILEATRGRRRRGRFPVAITFDDDLGSHARVAMPITTRMQLPAAFFVCGASLEEPFAFWWERLQTAVVRGLALTTLGLREASSIHEVALTIEALPPADRDALSALLESHIGSDAPDAGMRASDLERLVTAGFEIGFHTLRHDPLPALDDDALAEAMIAGRERLAALAGREVRMIAYPHGRADGRVAAAARRAGYELGFTCDFARIDADADPLLLGRIEPPFTSTGHYALRLARALTRQSHR